MSGNESEQRDQLREALLTELKSTGQLKQIEASLWQSFFRLLRHPTTPPPLSAQSQLINELVRQYLANSGYLATAEVLISETGLDKKETDPTFLSELFNLPSVPSTDTPAPPLLSLLVLGALKEDTLMNPK
ncbi:hypothetical protein LOD99_1134 [Oopsacas minuta]|uniref:LisH domain-containing protein n=1 Tax=Oopsacas minuta TaxID=111878 RepID=A0AAV7K6D2_9METZ|nr:hypothetical protein LOD99_1134 [Oopsacas minuta]